MYSNITITELIKWSRLSDRRGGRMLLFTGCAYGKEKNGKATCNQIMAYHVFHQADDQIEAEVRKNCEGAKTNAWQN